MPKLESTAGEKRLTNRNRGESDTLLVRARVCNELHMCRLLCVCAYVCAREACLSLRHFGLLSSAFAGMGRLPPTARHTALLRLLLAQRCC